MRQVEKGNGALLPEDSPSVRSATSAEHCAGPTPSDLAFGRERGSGMAPGPAGSGLRDGTRPTRRRLLEYAREVNLIGKQIGSYIVEKELGAGGTGTVYLCSHTLIERKVAIKVLHDDLASQPEQVARFFQEAKAAAEIGHPNIVVIIDFGQIDVPEGSRSYLMMECLDGASLDKRLRSESFTLDQIAHILSQVCSALMASHGKGIIHRDLKPANVQICPRSFDPIFVKLLDFGIAKLTAPLPDSRRTQYGMVLGTPSYMSPEQCEGKGAIDHRSDIYSLGVMLYEMLTGTVPFVGEIRDVLLGHMTKTPLPPRQRNPDIPPEWEALCLHMMEKSRDARFQSVSEVAQALADLPRHAQAYSAISAHPPSSSGHTMRLDPAENSRVAAERPTLHVSLNAVLGTAPGQPSPGSTRESSAPTAPHAGGGIPATASGSPTEHAPAAGQQPFGQPSKDGQPEKPPASPVPSSGRLDVAPPESTPLPSGSGEDLAGMAACYALVTDVRHAAFLSTLLVRPSGRWFNVAELCTTGQVAAPATLPPQPLFCCWLPHPWGDPSLVAVVFVSLRDGSNTVALCRRVSWGSPPG